MTADKIKKSFKKTIDSIRKERGEGKTFPKAMMTEAQISKGTATVNCGGEWCSADFTLNLAKSVASDPRFLVFLAEANAKAAIELNNFGTYQIRISYIADRYGADYYMKQMDKNFKKYGEKALELNSVWVCRLMDSGNLTEEEYKTLRAYNRAKYSELPI